MPCPYAAALSDDEDASYHAVEQQKQHLRFSSPSSSPTTNAIPSEALSAARLKCPAFANSACPFREAGADPDSLMEVMKTVPPSHFPSSSSALQKVVTSSSSSSSTRQEGNGRESPTAAATQFQLAMEHVHQVSSLLERSKQTENSSAVESEDNDGESSENQNFENALTKTKRDSFIIRGGCPFKSFHKEHHSFNNSRNGNEDTSKHLARAMEEFSLAAIMGRMASENFDDDEIDLLELDENDQQKANSSDEDPMTKEEDVTASISNTNNDDQQEEESAPPIVQQSFLSQALKTGTAESHTAAENVHFVNNFIKGIIDRELYMDLLTGLYHTYVTLEELLDEHAPTRFPTLHFPKELSRRETLEEDMEYWHGLDWRTDPACSKPSPAVQDYIDRMREVGSIDPLLLLSHAYTRYLGDLSGGKVLSRIARRALNLSGYDGLQFYKFDHVTSAKLFKDQYRNALDELVLTPDQIGGVVAEANVAFALNMRVFEELDVKGGVEGARVRNVREALSYYDVEMEVQKRKKEKGRDEESFDERGGGGVVDDGEEAKCPFGFKGGVNPHGPKVETKEVDAALDHAKEVPQSTLNSEDTPTTKHSAGEEKGRCPWPFVFFHDPIMGMKDWQTWFVIGLVSCWCWSCLQMNGEAILDDDTLSTTMPEIETTAENTEIRYWTIPV